MEISLIPVCILNRLGVREERQRPIAGILSVALLLLLWLLLVRAPELLAGVPHVCLFEALLGIPCPGCGVISSLVALGHGELRAAIEHNPIGPLFFAVLLLQLPTHGVVLLDSRRRHVMYDVARRVDAAMGVGLLGAWVIRLVH